jgi:hypothetical protein
VEQLNKLSLQQKIQASAAAVIALAAFLPWASIFGISVNGINGDGKITLILALAALVGLATQTGLTGDFTLAPKLVLGISILCAAIALLVAIVDMNEFAAIGLYLTLIASVVMAAAIIWEIRLGRAAPEPAETSPVAPEASPPVVESETTNP